VQERRHLSVFDSIFSVCRHLTKQEMCVNRVPADINQSSGKNLVNLGPGVQVMNLQGPGIQFQHLPATSNLVIPRCRLSTYGTRAFSVASPVCWNSLPDYLKSSDLSFNCFRQQLKHFYFVNIDISPSITLAH